MAHEMQPRETGMAWVSGGREAAANLVLAAPHLHIDGTRSVLFTKDARLEQRGVAIALLRSGEIRFAIAAIHLDGVEAPRLRHISELHQAVKGFAPGVPVVIAGDVNDVPGSRSWNALLALGADAFMVAGIGEGATSNVASRTRRIDAVFASAGITVIAAQVLDSADVRIASDHFPMIAELQLPN
jgi:endonuclease/exonuclease/phosphatase family metal-dependent hydrolase